MKSSKSKSQLRWNRRDFIKTSTLATGAVVFGVPTLLRAQNLNSKLNIASIGAMGKGESDTNDCSSENIVALCDVDDRSAANAWKRFPNARRFRDYRKMFETMAPEIDAVTVSTPDHTHFPASMWALRHKKHVYCQKPLTHTPWEARELTKAARKAAEAAEAAA